MSMNYRKLWESTNGPIPKDERGITYDIHHIDGDRTNNNIENLLCVSVEEHYQIHLKQFLETRSHKERAALNFLGSRLEKTHDDLTGHITSDETKKKISDSLKGRKRPKHIGEIVRKHHKGRKWSDEVIQKRREGMIKYYKNVDQEELNKRYDKISKSLTGNKLTEETKLKLSKLNSKLKDEEVLGIIESINNGVRYDDISEKYGISPAQISAIKQRKTYKWVYEKYEI